MRIGIVYDSIFGNTAQVAVAIETALKPEHRVQCVTVQDAGTLPLADLDLLILGSPTRGFRPTPLMADYADRIGAAPRSMQVAVFDTRMDLSTIRAAPLRWAMDVGGYAAARLADAARRQGFAIRGDPIGLLVTGSQGPLKPGALLEASQWARRLPFSAAAHVPGAVEG